MSATNDKLIFELCEDSNYQIKEDGTILTIIQRNGKPGVSWRSAGGSHTPHGYLSMRYKGTALMMHRVIWAKFKNYLRCDLVINHINGNKKDNSLGNLELVTERTNQKHAYSIGMKRVQRGNAKLSWNKVREIRNDWNNGQYTLRKLQEKYVVPKSTLHGIVTGKTYKPELENDEN